jgi:hypothetical protein
MKVKEGKLSIFDQNFLTQEFLYQLQLAMFSPNFLNCEFVVE